MADNIAVTPGSGATVAADDIGSVWHQRVKLSIGPDGSAADAHDDRPVPVELDTRDNYTVSTTNQTNVAAARTTHLDLFNAVGAGTRVKVHGIYIIPTLGQVTGVGLTWEIIRTSAVGTGGSTRTPALLDTTNAGVPAGLTCRGKPTGGATTSTTLFYPNTSSEETLPYGSQAATINHLPKPIILNNNEGVKVDQTTSSAVGSTNIVVTFSFV